MISPFIVAIGETTRVGSSGERIARLVLEAGERLGANTPMFAGPDLGALPHFQPVSIERTNSRWRDL